MRGKPEEKARGGGGGEAFPFSPSSPLWRVRVGVAFDY